MRFIVWARKNKHQGAIARECACESGQGLTATNIRQGTLEELAGKHLWPLVAGAVAGHDPLLQGFLDENLTIIQKGKLLGSIGDLFCVNEIPKVDIPGDGDEPAPAPGPGDGPDAGDGQGDDQGQGATQGDAGGGDGQGAGQGDGSGQAGGDPAQGQG